MGGRYWGRPTPPPTTTPSFEVKAVVSFEEGKIVMWERPKKSTEKTTKSTWELTGADEMVYTITIEGNTDLLCVQKMKKVD